MKCTKYGTKGNQANINMPTKRDEDVDCSYCGSLHERNKNKCPKHFGKVCEKCSLRNHLENCCTTRKQTRMRVNEIQEEESSDEFVLEIKSNKNCFKSKMLIYASLKREKYKVIECQLDTGATINVIGKKHLKEIMNNRKLIVKRSLIRLKAFGNTIVPSIGQIQMNCKHKKENHRLKFEFVENDHMPLLSGEAWLKMGFIKMCNALEGMKDAYNEAKRIVKNFNDIFQGLGEFDDEVKLHK